MALPTYTRTRNFAEDQNNNVGGRSTVLTAGLDTELNSIKSVLDVAKTMLAVLLNDDLSQKISAAAVSYIAASLGSGNVFLWRDQWLTTTAYVVNNMVFNGGSTYICLQAHTSGIFATDLAAGKWTLLAQQGSAAALPSQGGNQDKILTTDGASPSWAVVQTLPNSNTPAGTIAATTIQAAINELDGDVTALAAAKASLAVHNTFTKAQGVAQVALTDGANIATDASLGNVFSVTLAGNRTLLNPTNLVAGFTYIWNIKQDATGSRTLAYGALFKFPGGAAPVLTTAANSIDSLQAVYDGTVLRCSMTKDFR